MPKQLENSSFEHCANPGCKYMARYGFKGKQPTRCVYCRENGMVKLIGRKCEYIGCYNVPNYGFAGKIGTKCLSHADEGMIRIIAKKCVEDDCENTATNNGNLVVTHYCDDHWKKNAKKFIYLCEFETCKNIAEYIYKRKERFCHIHKKHASRKIHRHVEPEKKQAPAKEQILPEICTYNDSCQLLESMISPEFEQQL